MEDFKTEESIAKILCDARINEDLTINSLAKEEKDELKKMIDDDLNEHNQEILSKNGITRIINEIDFFGKTNPQSTIGALYTKLLKK